MHRFEEAFGPNNVVRVVEREWTIKAESGEYVCTVIVMAPYTGPAWRCGYVRMPLEHPWCVDMSRDDVFGRLESMNVHGGVTFAEQSSDGSGYWWIGFDCAHRGDTMANCTLEYVEGECRELMRQLADVADAKASR